MLRIGGLQIPHRHATKDPLVVSWSTITQWNTQLSQEKYSTRREMNTRPPPTAVTTSTSRLV